LRSAWLIWLAVTLPLSGYFLAGYVASRSASVPIMLSPGFVANQKLFRFGEDRLRMELEFRGKHTNRPELGEYGYRGDWRSTGRLEFPNPGAEIVLKVSSDALEVPTPYSALPKTGWNASHIYRDLVAELNGRPGIWEWPPANRGLPLQPGMNEVWIEVASVGPQLASESVQLLSRPEVGFKACGSQVCWLWGWFAWPLFLVVQLIWASILFKDVGSRTTK
jgi:hypothetical protein